MRRTGEKIVLVGLNKLIKEEVAAQLAAQTLNRQSKSTKTKLVTQKELKSELSLSDASLWRYRKKGMPYNQAEPGMKILYDVEEVTKWIGGQKYGR